MEKSVVINKYELIVIVDARLSSDEKDAVLKDVTEAVNKAGAKVINSQVWQEKQKFTFDIKKCSEGTYYLINFEGEGSSVEKIRPILKLNEKVLRFSTISVD